MWDLTSASTDPSCKPIKTLKQDYTTQKGLRVTKQQQQLRVVGVIQY